MHPARRPWWRTVAAVVATAALVPVAAYVATGSAQAATAVPTSFSFAGSGFGHGVGLSQYGARGMALEGSTATQIAEHYYTGTTVVPVKDSMNLRVNLLHARPSAVFRTEALTAGGGAIEVTVTGKAPVLGTPADTWTVVAGTGVITLLRTRAGVTTTIGTGTYVVVRWAGTRNPGSAGAGATVLNLTTSVAGLAATGHRYKYGWVDFGTTAAAPRTLEAVGSFRLHDEYLRGIGEMPSLWPAAALQAQVIAARTYALSRYGTGLMRAACRCHVDSGKGPYYDESYLGWIKETSTAGALWRAAVAATLPTSSTGLTVTSAGKPITAFFFAASGGRTQSSREVWGGVLPYAVSTDDHWSMDPSVPWSSWIPRVRTQAKVAAAFGLPNVVRLDLSARTAGGAVKTAVAYSSTGATASITGETFRSRLALPSTWVSGVTDTVTGASLLTTTTPTAPTTTKVVLYPGKPFGLGAKGPYVSELQRHLGFTRGLGTFTVATQTRVKAAQVRVGLRATGVVDGKTWVRITGHK